MALRRPCRKSSIPHCQGVVASGLFDPISSPGLQLARRRNPPSFWRLPAPFGHSVLIGNVLVSRFLGVARIIVAGIEHQYLASVGTQHDLGGMVAVALLVLPALAGGDRQVCDAS